MNRAFLFLFCMGMIMGQSCKEKTKTATATQEQKNQKIGGGCDGCELMFVEIPKDINSIDTSAAWFEAGERLLIKGTAVKADNTLAKDVLIYYWHTDKRGYYSPAVNQNEKSKRHGHIRGWVKTDKDGKFFIYTIRPGAYPNESMPAHIHMSIKEKNIKNEYYIDDLIFADDDLITEEYKSKLTNRGGSGILYPAKQTDNVWLADYKLTLGMNIPFYPTNQ